jgi:hypothetical protein
LEGKTKTPRGRRLRAAFGRYVNRSLPTSSTKTGATFTETAEAVNGFLQWELLRYIHGKGDVFRHGRCQNELENRANTAFGRVVEIDLDVRSSSSGHAAGGAGKGTEMYLVSLPGDRRRPGGGDAMLWS